MALFSSISISPLSISMPNRQHVTIGLRIRMLCPVAALTSLSSPESPATSHTSPKIPNSTPFVDSSRPRDFGFNYDPNSSSLGPLVCFVHATESNIERIIFDFRFLALFAVAGSLAGSLLCFLNGCVYIIDAYKVYWIGCLKDEKFCNGEEVLRRYREIVPSLRLSGNSFFLLFFLSTCRSVRSGSFPHLSDPSHSSYPRGWIVLEMAVVIEEHRQIAVGTWVPKIGESGRCPLAMLRPSASLSSALNLLIQAPNFGSKRVGLIGLGQSASTTLAFRNFGEAIASTAKAAQASNIGTVLGIYEDTRYKSDSKKPMLKSVDILGLGTGAELEKKLKFAEDVSSAVIFGKELVNSPANVLTPAALAEEASKIASAHSDVFSATILNAEECKELKMGSYLGVAAASANPPHFIHLHYKPPSGAVKAKLALVGKGLTFDSGGYNIKTGPGCSIELMKFDMGGSAAVLGAAKAIGLVKPPGVEVHFIVAACENMISGTGMRPGDIVTASNGKTIEVNNTDAEGRLTLADALVYACNQGVDKVVDLATLTGACVVALGPSIAGIFTPSDELAKEVFAAAEISGEKLWRLPLEETYWESMKSGVADMVNTGGRQGGSITAALFLKQFINDKVEWMHIDMAGPVWNEKKKSATGFGIATLVEWVVQNSS